MTAYSVHAPTNAGTYAQQYGWFVKTPTGYVAYSGARSECRAYARAMNSR